MRPDVVMYVNEFPATIIEVHYSPYENSLRKLSYLLLTQLRFLRNYNREILMVEGSVFPKIRKLLGCVK